MKFLETITSLDRDCLVAIDKIEYINFGYYENGWALKISAPPNHYEEHFQQDEKKARTRYEMIKKILKAE